MSNLDMTFQSSHELGNALSEIGYEISITQLSNGAQEGSFRALSSKENVLICKLNITQDISIEGTRNADYTPFVITSGPMLDHGETVGMGSLFHFCKELKQTSSIQYSGSTMRVLLIPSDSILKNTSNTTLDIINRSNSIHPSTDGYKYLSQKLDANAHTHHTSLDEWILTIEAVILSSEKHNKHQKNSDWELISKLIEQGYKHLAYEPLRIESLCKILFTNKNKLYQLCQENFSRSPMQMIKGIRLEQIRRLLEKPELREAMYLQTIEDIRIYYGFNNLKRFRHDYSELFNELPSQTIQRNPRQF